MTLEPEKKFFETLYELLAEEILLRAYAYFKNRSNTELLAEEALQNTFEKLMRKDLAFFREIADLKAYVMRVAYSQFAMCLSYVLKVRGDDLVR
jgi:DNA-directed RNA polymerase specialized sigma24 family protein